MKDFTGKRQILFCLSGSIACFKAAQTISLLVQRGYTVQTAATAGALKFLGEATLEGLTGRPVFHDIFASGQAMDHIHWARWAQLSILCPASASALSRLAQAASDDVVSTLFMAHELSRGSFWVAPAMNSLMWEHPATQRVVQDLKSWGVRVLEGQPGALACGEWGPGRLIEPEALVREVDQFCVASTRTPRRLLVTSGGTREPIDDVRCITNISTGTTGALIVQGLLAAGHEVTWLRAQDSPVVGPHPRLRQEIFSTTESLAAMLQRELTTLAYDGIVHAAAVSDFKVARPAGGKLSSLLSTQVRLEPTLKIVDQLRAWSQNPKLSLVAFKLTSGATESERNERALELMRRAQADLVVHNDLREFSADSQPYVGLGHDGIEFRGKARVELATSLERWLSQR